MAYLNLVGVSWRTSLTGMSPSLTALTTLRSATGTTDFTPARHATPTRHTATRNTLCETLKSKRTHDMNLLNLIFYEKFEIHIKSVFNIQLTPMNSFVRYNVISVRVSLSDMWRSKNLVGVLRRVSLTINRNEPKSYVLTTFIQQPARPIGDQRNSVYG